MYKYLSSILVLVILASCGTQTKAPLTIRKESTKKILKQTKKTLEQKYHINNAEIALIYNLEKNNLTFTNKDYVNIINSNKYSKNFLARKHNFSKQSIEKNARIRLEQFRKLATRLEQNKIQYKGLKIPKSANSFAALTKLHYNHARFMPILFPSSSGCITSYYGVRFHPIHRKKKFHYGIDIASQKRLIFSSAEGVVESVSRNNGYGNNLTINHGNGIKTFYAHLNKILVSPKQKVLQGELIGVEGNSGATSGVHLHFETIYRGNKVNPMLFLAN